MLKPLGYTYNGRPLMESGAHFRRSRGSYGRKRGPSFLPRLLLLIGLILILAGAAFAVWKTFRKDPAIPAVTEEETVAETPAVPVAPVPKHASPVPQPEKTALPNPPERDMNPEMNRQALQVFSAANKAFQQGRYEDARKALRLFIEGLSVPVTHHLYQKACDLLGKASFRLLNEGKDPADFLDYEVKSGDNLARLAKKYDTGVQEIMEASGIERTSLKVGQKLRIPLSTWGLRIDRENNRIFLDKNGRLFKVYPIQTGARGRAMKPGLYRVVSKQADPVWKHEGRTAAAHTPENPLGGRLLTLNSQNAEKPGIHGRSGATGRNADAVWFSMTEPDVQELYGLVPKGTPVEILEKH